MSVLACDSTDGIKNTVKLTPKNLADIKTLQLRKRIIDSLLIRKTFKAVVFIKDGQGNLMRSTNSPFSDSTDVQEVYIIQKDDLGKIVCAQKTPIFPHGALISFSQYFNNRGETFAFEKTATYTALKCVKVFARETKTQYFNSKFDIIFQSYELVDENLNPLSCEIPDYAAYKVSADLKTYLQENRINLESPK